MDKRNNYGNRGGSMSLFKILLLIVSVAVLVYTISYAVWEWKNNNKFGSVFVYALAFAEVVLSIYTVFIN